MTAPKNAAAELDALERFIDELGAQVAALGPAPSRGAEWDDGYAAGWRTATAAVQRAAKRALERIKWGGS